MTRASPTAQFWANEVTLNGVCGTDARRRDLGGDVLLYALGPGSRYEIQTVVPLGTPAGSTLRYFARATDVGGQRRDSTLVSVQVLP